MINKILSRIKLIFINIGMAIYSLTWKKDKSSILIGSWFGEKFADNSRFLFQYLIDHKKELELSHIGWVTRSEEIYNMMQNMGYEVYLMGTKESRDFHKKAGYHIICDSSDSFASIPTDIETRYSWRSKRINLWHGIISFKGVGYGARSYEQKKKNHPVIYKIKEVMHRNSIFRKFTESEGGWGDCYFLSTTPYKTASLTKYFMMPQDHYIETAVARVCGKVKPLPLEEKVKNMMKNHPCICYFPTFRGVDSSFDVNTASEEIKNFLSENNILWVQKFHSASKQRTESLNICGNIVTLPHDFDINTIIPDTTILITDYSSVTGDAIFHNKPLIFFIPDFEEYNSTDRGFIINPSEVMVGSKPKTTEDLKKEIKIILETKFKPDERYKKLKDQYYNDKHIEDIWKDIKNRLG